MAQFMLIILLFPPDGIHYQDNTAGSTFYSYENGEQRASNKGRDWLVRCTSYSKITTH